MLVTAASPLRIIITFSFGPLQLFLMCEPSPSVSTLKVHYVLLTLFTSTERYRRTFHTNDLYRDPSRRLPGSDAVWPPATELVGVSCQHSDKQTAHAQNSLYLKLHHSTPQRLEAKSSILRSVQSSTHVHECHCWFQTDLFLPTCYPEAAEGNRATDQQKTGLESKASKKSVSCQLKDALDEPAQRVDFMVWEGEFTYFKHFHEYSDVTVTNSVAKLQAVVINSPKEKSREFWTISDVYLLFLVNCFCCWRTAAGYVSNNVLIKDSSNSSHPLLIRMIFLWPRAHIEGLASLSLSEGECH